MTTSVRQICGLTLMGMALHAGMAPHDALGQFLNQSIGGVRIDTSGALEAAPDRLSENGARQIQGLTAEVPATFHDAGMTRVISLRSLQDELRQVLEKGEPLPEALRFLAGLQHVDSIVVDPQNQDLLIAGPADRWTIDARGDVVGETNGQPILRLDDLLVAWRSSKAARDTGITCSIDPTAEGRQSLDRYLNHVRRFDPSVPPAIERALGPQQVTIVGVPQDSHLACVLAAADFQMKRYAMNLQPAPVPGLPGFLDLIRQRRSAPKDLMPRWWLSAEYRPPARSQDGLVWQLEPCRVQAQTEDEFVAADGSVRGTGQANPTARQWAENMTEQYPALAEADSTFAQLQNVMDLALVAAIIHHHDLPTLAGCDVSLLSESDSALRCESWVAPKSVTTQSSFIKVGREFVITASGGVDINPWSMASQPQPLDGPPRRTASRPSQTLTRWCWE